MRLKIYQLILAILLSFTMAECTIEQEERTQSIEEPNILVLEDVTVIDGTGAKPQPHAVIVIEGDRIREIGPKDKIRYSRAAKIIPGKGRYVIPGLFDLHAHVTFLRDPNRFAGYDRDTTERILKILLAHGITTVRNPAAPSTEAVVLRDNVRGGKTTGPRIFTAGEPINWGVEKSAEDVRAEVRRQAKIGVDYIKVYARMPPELIRAAIEEAHKHGLKVVGHLDATTATEAVRVGIDAVTHGATWSTELLPPARREAYLKRRQEVGPMLARLDWLEWADLGGPEIKEMISIVAQARVPLDPTLIAYVTKFRGRDPRYRNSPGLMYAPRPVLETWEGALKDWREKDFQRGARLWPKILQLIKAYYDNGVLLTAGSDFPNPWVIPGFSLHDEFELLAEAGIPPLEIIKIATSNSAEGLGILNDVGTLEVRKRADLVILSADPVADIRNIRKVEQVILGGKILDVSFLLKSANIPEAVIERKVKSALR